MQASKEQGEGEKGDSRRSQPHVNKECGGMGKKQEQQHIRAMFSTQGAKTTRERNASSSLAFLCQNES